MHFGNTGRAFAIVTPVGKNPAEAERIDDLIDSLEAHEPGRYWFVMVNDGLDPSLYRDRLSSRLRDRFLEIENPRQGRGDGWAAGCAVGVLAGIQHVLHSGCHVDFVLKLDTDALVIAPFSETICAEFRKDPAIGILGQVRDPSTPERQCEQMTPLGYAMDKLMQQLTIWRKTPLGPPKLQIGLFGDSRVIRNTLRFAFVKGARVGEHCYGGAYAISRPCCEDLDQSGLLRKPTIWLRTPLPEDILISFCTQSLGYSLKDFSQPGELFAVRYQGLPASPAELVTARRSLIHSVKDFGTFKERDTRSYFRERRTGAAVQSLA